MAFTMFLLPTILTLMSAFVHVQADGDKPDYKFILDKLTKENEAVDIIKTDLTFDKQENEIKISGEVQQLVDMDDTWKVNIEIHRADKANGEYSKMMTLPQKGVCDLMKSYYKSYFYESLKNYSNAPDPNNCPVIKETYNVQNYPLDSSKFKKFLKPGYYRILITLLEDDSEQLKYIIDGHVEEA